MDSLRTTFSWKVSPEAPPVILVVTDVKLGPFMEEPTIKPLI